MSVYNGQASGSTYQSIVIALVAGGILSTGALSILWKRRQARRWAELRRRLPPGGDAAMGIGGGRGGGDGKGIGREPGIWDVVFGSKGSLEKKLSRGIEEKEEMEESEVDLDGDMKIGWRPTSLSLISNPLKPSPISDLKHATNPPPPTSQSPTTAEITVLIAMPDEHANAVAGPSRPSQLSSHNPNDRSSPYDLPDYSPVYHYPTTSDPSYTQGDEYEDERPLPPLELGLASISVSPQPFSNSGLKDKSSTGSAIEDMMRKAGEEREAASSRRNRHRNRAWDGVQSPSTTPGAAQTRGDMLNTQSAAGRFALLRNGALAGFGPAPSRR